MIMIFVGISSACLCYFKALIYSYPCIVSVMCNIEVFFGCFIKHVRWYLEWPGYDSKPLQFRRLFLTIQAIFEIAI